MSRSILLIYDRIKKFKEFYDSKFDKKIGCCNRFGKYLG